MALNYDSEDWRQRLAALPLATYQPGETVFEAGTKTGRLMILKSGAVSITKGDIEFAQVSEPGAVFGELSALLDAPHSADVIARETSEFSYRRCRDIAERPGGAALRDSGAGAADRHRQPRAPAIEAHARCG